MMKLIKNILALFGLSVLLTAGHVPGASDFMLAWNALADGEVMAKGAGAYGTAVLDANKFTTTAQVHTTGTSLTVNADTDVVYVNPATVLSSLTITLPATPEDQQEIEFHFGGTIDPTFPVANMLTLPATVYAGSLLTSASGSDSFTLRYDATSAKWYF